MKGNLTLAEAQAVAAEVMTYIVGACVRIQVAGSIRRRKAIVGDIEIVALPRYVERQVGLFPDDVDRVNLLQHRLDDALAGGVLQPDPDDPKRGARYAKLRHAASGAQVDLFMPATADIFGLALLIRTGPADYSHRFVTEMKRAPHPHHVARSELHAGPGLICAPADSPLACRVVPTPDEANVYAALGWPFVEPEARA